MKILLLILYFLVFSNPVFADDEMDLGLTVYNDKAQCGTCHALKAAGSDGQIGPNLDQIRPDKNRVMMTVKNGIGIMPAYEGELTLEEIEAVSIYVSTVAGN